MTPQTPDLSISIIILEALALSIFAGLTRLFLMERTIVGGLKTFFGGIFFGTMIGYLTKDFNLITIYYFNISGAWKIATVFSAIFGREILKFFKNLITDISPIMNKFIINQGQRIAEAIRAYKNFKK